jgi:hypothetical protein
MAFLKDLLPDGGYLKDQIRKDINRINVINIDIKPIYCHVGKERLEILWIVRGIKSPINERYKGKKYRIPRFRLAIELVRSLLA